MHESPYPAMSLHELRLDELRHLPCHLHQLGQRDRLETIARIYPDVLIPHLLALRRIRAHATHTHSRNKLRKISHLQMTVIQIVHQEIGIRGNLVALVIETTTHHHLTLDVASRMQRQPTASHLPASILATNPFSHHLLRVLLVHVDTIGIEEVAIRLLHLLHHMRHRILGKDEVVRMAKSDDIACRHPNALVDSLIHAMVRLRDKLHLVLMPSYRLTDYFHGTVFRYPVHDDILNVRIILRQHTLYTTTNRLLTVVTTCYN